MTYDPNNRRPSRLEPLSPGATPPVESAPWHHYVIALIAVIGLISGRVTPDSTLLTFFDNHDHRNRNPATWK
jgi:hypothetical protein